MVLDEYAVTEIGISCSDSSRFVAVTMISSRTPACSGMGGNENAPSANSNMDRHEIRRATKVDIVTCPSPIYVNGSQRIMDLCWRQSPRFYGSSHYIIIYFIKQTINNI